VSLKPLVIIQINFIDRLHSPLVTAMKYRDILKLTIIITAMSNVS